jgi:hypothetical protein
MFLKMKITWKNVVRRKSEGGFPENLPDAG